MHIYQIIKQADLILLQKSLNRTGGDKTQRLGIEQATVFH